MKITDMDTISMDPELLQMEQLFFGAQSGVGLLKRGKNDNHVCFVILGEDDGHWFVRGDTSVSIVWMDDLKDILDVANEWVKSNCIPNAWGYEFPNE